MPDDTVDATFYVQLRPDRGFGPIIRKARAVRVTQTRPDQPLGDAVTVKLTVRLPAAAFRPLEPEAVVVIPEALAKANVEVTAGDPVA